MRFSRVLMVLAGIAVGNTAALAQGQGSQFGADAFRPGPGIANPVEVRFSEPKYTKAALDAHIQGMVVLEAIVQPNGTVGDVRVIQSLDAQFGLDQEAVKAVKNWLFRPGMKDGRAVPMIVTLEVMFRSRGSATGLATEPAPVRYAIVAKPPQDPIKLPDDGFATGAYGEDTPGLTVPKVKYQTEPKYTSDAMRAKIQGAVVVEAIVGTDGTVTKARVFESLDKVYGLDASALDTAKRFTFEPGTLAGQKVSVYIRLEFLFRLH